MYSSSYYTQQPGSSPSASYGLSCVPQILAQLYNAGHMNFQEYQLLIQDTSTDASKYNIAKRLTDKFGSININPAEVQSTVQQILIGGLTRLRQGAMMQQGGAMPVPYANPNMYTSPWQQTPTYYTNPNQMAMADGIAPGMVPSQGNEMSPPSMQTAINNMNVAQANASYQQPAQMPTQQTTTEEINVDMDLTTSTEKSFCGEATISPAKNPKETLDTFNITKIQEIVGCNTVQCGSLNAINMNVAYYVPCHNRNMMLAAMESYNDILEPEQHTHVTLIEWHRAIHIPRMNPTNALSVFKQCHDIFVNKKKNIGVAVMAINDILAGAGTFGSILHDILLSEINKYSAAVLSRYNNGGFSTLTDFTSLNDFSKLISPKDQTYQSWRQPVDKYKSNTIKLIIATYGRLFDGLRKPYLDINNPADIDTLATDPFVPYRYRGYPWYRLPRQLRDDLFVQEVKNVMNDSMTVLITHRTLLHNLPLTKDITQDHCPITNIGPAERILEKMYRENGLLEVIDANNSTTRTRPYVLGIGYNNELVFTR